jgi:monoamine oxidase
MFKMFLAYHEPWWENLGIKKGRSLTDLPIRQTYYWGTEGEQEGANPNNRNAALMATYDDSMNVDFWVGLDSKRERKKLQTRPHAFNEPAKLSPWDDYLANESMADEMNRQLAMMHGLKYLPPYYSAVYKNWGEDPYGGAIHLWNIHAKSWEVIPYMVNPTSGQYPVYICGEAYSHEQGWVEGALDTAEMMLQSYFNLPEPAWI